MLVEFGASLLPPN